MKKIKVFLSSKVDATFQNIDVHDYTLRDLRQQIKKEFEAIEFLGERIFSIVVNESSFSSNFTKDAFETCLDNVRKSDIIIILYNGDAGYAQIEDSQGLGICHQEYLTALQYLPTATRGIDISSYFADVEYNDNQKLRNERFHDDLQTGYHFIEQVSANTKEQINKEVSSLITGYIKTHLTSAIKAQKKLDATKTIFGKTLDWTKMTYNQRSKEMKYHAENAFSTVFKKTICKYHSIPDNMSVSDARNEMGRPFLYEHELVDEAPHKSGVVHFVSIYGACTATQIKSLIGFPDITIIKSTFGFYCWVQSTQIQFFFITKCINPYLFQTRKTQILNWLNSTKEDENIIKRAKARFNILKAIAKAQKETGNI